MRRMLAAGIAVLVVATTAWGADAPKLPTTDELMAKMKAKWDGVKTLEMDTKFTTDFGDPKSGATINMHLVAERQEKEGKVVERSVLTAKRVWKKPDGKVQTDEARGINDGSYVWEEERSSEHEGIRVRKANLREAGVRGASMIIEWGPQQLQDRIEDRRVKIVGEETIDGKKMYVLEGSQDPAKYNGRISTSKVWVGEDDLFAWRIVDTMDDGKLKQVTTGEITSVKVDQKIDPKEFEYKVPEGATLDDRTKKE